MSNNGAGARNWLNGTKALQSPLWRTHGEQRKIKHPPKHPEPFLRGQGALSPDRPGLSVKSPWPCKRSGNRNSRHKNCCVPTSYLPTVLDILPRTRGLAVRMVSALYLCAEQGRHSLNAQLSGSSRHKAVRRTASDEVRPASSVHMQPSLLGLLKKSETMERGWVSEPKWGSSMAIGEDSRLGDGWSRPFQIQLDHGL